MTFSPINIPTSSSRSAWNSHYSKSNEFADKGADRYFIAAFSALHSFAGVRRER